MRFVEFLPNWQIVSAPSPASPTVDQDALAGKISQGNHGPVQLCDLKIGGETANSRRLVRSRIRCFFQFRLTFPLSESNRAVAPSAWAKAETDTHVRSPSRSTTLTSPNGRQRMPPVLRFGCGAEWSLDRVRDHLVGVFSRLGYTVRRKELVLRLDRQRVMVSVWLPRWGGRGMVPVEEDDPVEY